MHRRLWRATHTFTCPRFPSRRCSPRLLSAVLTLSIGRAKPGGVRCLVQAGFQRRSSSNLRDNADDGRKLLALADPDRDGVRGAAPVLLRNGLVCAVLADEGCDRAGDIFGAEAQVIIVLP